MVSPLAARPISPLNFCSYNCGMEGHVSKECTAETKAKTCYKCGQEGHIVSIKPVIPGAPAESQLIFSLPLPVSRVPRERDLRW